MKTEIERVRERIGEELSACADVSPEGTLQALESRLVRPPRQGTFTSDFDSSPSGAALWVVLDECPGQAAGYLVVYDAARDEFGLAGKGAGGQPGVVVGWYGSLRDTIEAM